MSKKWRLADYWHIETFIFAPWAIAVLILLILIYLK